MATLALNGLAPSESYFSAQRGPDTIKRGFRWKSSPAIIQPANCYPVFNLTSDTVNGVPFRTMNDDMPPVMINGAHLGANHALVGGRMTHMAHGKTNADIGSVWSNGSNQFVFIRPLGSNQVLLAGMDTDAVPPTGTFTHVSGAANTASIVATAATLQLFHPMIANYTIRVTVDDAEISSDTGTWTCDRAAFIESYDVLARSDVLGWFDNNGSAGGMDLEGSPLFSVSNAYVFDHEANLSIHSEFVGRNAATLSRIYGVQAQHAGATFFYIPKTVPIVHDGVTKDYSLIYSAAPTSTEVVFDTSNTEADGLYLDRFLTMNASYAMACGFAPMLDADIAQRRSIVTGTGMHIASSGKVYCRAVDQGGHGIAAGDRYGFVAYRNIIVRNALRTSAYPVRVGAEDFFYADWHDTTKVDCLPIPSDMIGREFSIVEKSDNVSVMTGILTGSLLVDVATAASYGYLVLRIEH